jgi:Spy/CpxP family protein refolding chaperone
MKHTTKTLLSTAILTASLGAGGFAFAHDAYPGAHGMTPPMYGPWQDCNQPRHMKYGPHGMGEISYLADKLDLSKDQRKVIRKIMDEERAKTRELGESMYENREDIEDLLGDNGYAPEYDKLARKQGEMIGEMMILRAKTQAQVVAVLDDEQKKVYRKFRDDFPGHRFGAWDWDRD